MKLEAGMWVKIKNSYDMIEIVKIKKIKKFSTTTVIVYEENRGNYDVERHVMINKVINVSHNIIDIIEEGDYVNEYEVFGVAGEDETVIEKFLITDKGIIKNDEIKSVVTKEYFEQGKTIIKENKE